MPRVAAEPANPLSRFLHYWTGTSVSAADDTAERLMNRVPETCPEPPVWMSAEAADGYRSGWAAARAALAEGVES